MYDHKLHREKTHFCHYRLQAFRTAEKLKCHIKDCFKLMINKLLRCLRRVNILNLKTFGRKIKLPFMIYADFKSILAPENNGKQNPTESYTNKYQTYAACSYAYKLVYVHDKLSKPFKSYLGENAVYNFISSMIEESKYCSDVMKKHFNKELVMTKEDNEEFKTSTKCWICDNDYFDTDVKVPHIEIVISMSN